MKIFNKSLFFCFQYTSKNIFITLIILLKPTFTFGMNQFLPLVLSPSHVRLIGKQDNLLDEDWPSIPYDGAMKSKVFETMINDCPPSPGDTLVLNLGECSLETALLLANYMQPEAKEPSYVSHLINTFTINEWIDLVNTTNYIQAEESHKSLITYLQNTPTISYQDIRLLNDDVQKMVIPSHYIRHNYDALLCEKYSEEIAKNYSVLNSDSFSFSTNPTAHYFNEETNTIITSDRKKNFLEEIRTICIQKNHRFPMIDTLSSFCKQNILFQEIDHSKDYTINLENNGLSIRSINRITANKTETLFICNGIERYGGNSINFVIDPLNNTIFNTYEHYCFSGNNKVLFATKDNFFYVINSENETQISNSLPATRITALTSNNDGSLIALATLNIDQTHSVYLGKKKILNLVSKK